MLVHTVLNSATVKNNDLHVLMRKIFAPVVNMFIGNTVNFVKVEYETNQTKEGMKGGTFKRQAEH